MKLDNIVIQVEGNSVEENLKILDFFKTFFTEEEQPLLYKKTGHLLNKAYYGVEKGRFDCRSSVTEGVKVLTSLEDLKYRINLEKVL